ncbi:glycogen debranching protein GlgX [Roseateles sp. BYS180W]|uniref:Glycogen debranching protein GlgX n=1 Tax=Roseateles rivi TaxID=3299028 RepID=A0ABW7FS31_9BURK
MTVGGLPLSISLWPEQLRAGRPYPLGAQVGPQQGQEGVNFAVFSEHAEALELCLFAPDGVQELRRYALHGPHDGVFHGFLPGVGAGLLYGLRAYGPYDPKRGHRFNPHKLLLDPYAREIVGHFDGADQHHGYVVDHPEGTHSFDVRDNAVQALKACVPAPLVGPSPRHSAPRIAPADMVLYELHVKGFSMQHPGIPPALQGSYAGLAHPAAIAHFKALGVTTLSLLPVHYALDEPHLRRKGLRNYWGYNTLGYFAPDPRWAQAAHRRDPSAVAAEFRAMVAALHEAGLEVVLDVVYNHSAEGNEWGPTLCWRGLDNASYYRLQADDKSRSENLTGCGNTLNVAHPRVTQLVLDSLRFWVQEMGVDGFRFDLAPVLGRVASGGFDPQAAFFTALRQDPLLAQVHLIAEPWDAAGFDAYQTGRFPGRFMEWNDKFRDAVRAYWLGPHCGGPVAGRGEFARRLCASSDLFQHSQRLPWASINYLSAHDGFTLQDVVSYSRKHNHANGEDNRDGRDGELSANFGVEGPSLDPTIAATRERVRRAMLASLLLAQGTPMLLAGDDIANSQGGNNNAYCQDNPTGWLDWAQAQTDLTAFVAELLRLRRQHPLLRHTHWHGAAAPVAGEACLSWHTPEGAAMQLQDWHAPDSRAFACVVHPATAHEAVLALVFNPEQHDLPITLPEGTWRLLLDSSGMLRPQALPHPSLCAPAHSLLLLCAAPESGAAGGLA